MCWSFPITKQIALGSQGLMELLRRYARLRQIRKEHEENIRQSHGLQTGLDCYFGPHLRGNQCFGQ